MTEKISNFEQAIKEAAERHGLDEHGVKTAKEVAISRAQLYDELQKIHDSLTPMNYNKEHVIAAHMAGQTNAGCKKPSYMNALSYYNTLTVEDLRKGAICTCKQPKHGGEYCGRCHGIIGKLKAR